MPHGERCHDRNQRAEAPDRNHHARQEQKRVGSIHDVLDDQSNNAERRRMPASAARDLPSRGSPSRTSRESERQVTAAPGRKVSTGAKSREPCARSGKLISRIALSGTRTMTCSRPPSGLTNACTVTSFGMSCGAATRGKAQSIAASTTMLVRALGMTRRVTSLSQPLVLLDSRIFAACDEM